MRCSVQLVVAERGNRDAKLIVNKWDGRIELRKAKKF